MDSKIRSNFTIHDDMDCVIIHSNQKYLAEFLEVKRLRSHTSEFKEV